MGYGRKNKKNLLPIRFAFQVVRAIDYMPLFLATEPRNLDPEIGKSYRIDSILAN
jgi:hypothetical protein